MAIAPCCPLPGRSLLRLHTSPPPRAQLLPEMFEGADAEETHRAMRETHRHSPEETLRLLRASMQQAEVWKCLHMGGPLRQRLAWDDE